MTRFSAVPWNRMSPYRRQVSLRRPVAVEDPTTGELTAQWAELPAVVAEVQPIDSTKIFNSRLATQYGQLWTGLFPPRTDVAPGDRATIDGAEVIVIEVTDHRTHISVMFGSVEPTPAQAP